jgi:hypothetical protein
MEKKLCGVKWNVTGALLRRSKEKLIKFICLRQKLTVKHRMTLVKQITHSEKHSDAQNAMNTHSKGSQLKPSLTL